jgi:DNA polymerase-3 subunit delta
MTLVAGPEQFLSERAVADLLARARHDDPDTDVTRLDAADTTPAELSETLSPSLFAASRATVVSGIDQCSDELAAELERLAESPPDGAVLVLVHPGGNKGKRLLDSLRKRSVPEVRCDAVKRADDVLDFVAREAKAHRGRIDRDAAVRLVDVLGGDLRGLASMTEQLVADGEGHVSSELVGSYVDGRADVKGWAVADLTITGQTSRALAELRWALAGGTDAVLVIGALAGSLRNLIRLAAIPRGYREVDIARDLEVPSWKVRILRGQLRGWTTDGLARALQAVARADLDIKGGSSDHALALSAAVLAVIEARDANQPAPATGTG